MRKAKFERLVRELTTIHQKEKRITDYPSRKEQKVQTKVRTLVQKISKELVKNPALEATTKHPPEIVNLIHPADR